MSDLLNRIDLRFDLVQERLSNYTISPSGCWEYQGNLRNGGYGEFFIYVNEFRPQKRKFRASRVAYALFNGVDPGELYVCHRCDNPCCINPGHLFLGTPKENIQDMFAKGRAAPQDGENNPASKLTEAVVIDVVRKIRAGAGNKQIAAELPISHSLVSLIRLGKAWTHVLSSVGYDPSEHRRFTRKQA